jgi:hypothetical protein
MRIRSFGQISPLQIALPLLMARVSILFVSIFSVTTRTQSPGAREFLNIPVNEGLFYIDSHGIGGLSIAKARRQ